ncbi:CoA-binding protein [uncultured Jannaschia sp.]|uniref:CoA-binding protein n=1 Tax=uncultured Jannaschia sp. TaxID=293347 RepID=UPI0026184D36|nr:CoA-binding protein [uncultured Jannaschia sp.]
MADLSDDDLRDLLARARRFACVGASANPARPSHYVSRYLIAQGYDVVPVNPGLAGQVVFGRQAVGSLSEIKGPVDVLDVFRRSEAVSDLVRDALATLPALQCVWLQLGVFSDEAVEMCREAGVGFVQDRCPKIEHARLIA